MSTAANQYPNLHEIVELIESVRDRRWRLNLIRALLAFVGVSLVAFIPVVIVLGFWPAHPPQWARIAAGVCVGGTSAGAFVWFVVRALMWRQNHAQTARFIEASLPSARNDLINSLLLGKTPVDGTSPAMIRRAIDEAAYHARRLDVKTTASPKLLKNWAVVMGVTVAVLGVFSLLWPQRLSRGMAAMTLRPFVPVINNISLISISPGDATVDAGEPLTIIARIDNNSITPHDAELLIADEPSIPMIADEFFGRFSADIGAVERSFSYRVRIGESSWPVDRGAFNVTVNTDATIKSLGLRYVYPAYTRIPTRILTDLADGEIEATLGSIVTVSFTTTRRASAFIELMDGKREQMTENGEGFFSFDLPLHGNGGYRIHIVDAGGRTLDTLPRAPGEGGYGTKANIRRKGFFPIVVQDDQPPQIEIIEPDGDRVLGASDPLRVRIRFMDDHGLASGVLLAGKQGQEPDIIKRFDHITGNTDAIVEHMLDLSDASSGETVIYYAVVEDGRSIESLGLGPQRRQSNVLRVEIKNTSELAQADEAAHADLMNRLRELLALQKSARVDTEICLHKHDTVELVVSEARDILRSQTAIRDDLLELASGGPAPSGCADIRHALGMLADKAAAVACERARAIANIEELSEKTQPATQLASAQDRIISVIQDILAVMPSIAPARDLQSPAAREAMDVDAAQKLRQLTEDLRRFAEEQQRVIETMNNLAPRPADSFDEEGRKLLDELRATQDRWDRFLDEAFSDLSKLPEQDFSNPQMLKELISVQTDITMAMDALNKQAIEIATALEANGIENAQTLTANIEKWLSDVPDREKWSMEGLLDEDMIAVEQPELPAELEDLIGDLLEEEEDIFEEMQDISGQYATSGDKGMGWDALDGPIISMNAHGVTGNQLPNKSEVSGRSGEGRQGKATGEYVEDKAVGKGGRRTPTRLTGEPFQRGEIRDVSEQSPAGATGGGKLSGSGGEGLEGPLAPELGERLDQLARRQANLVTRARRFLDNNDRGGYASYRLLSAVTLMDQVASDLGNYRYHNALRRRDAVIESLVHSRDVAHGAIRVRKDSSSTMPRYVRENMSDDRRGKLPEEYRDVLESYYRRLSSEQ